MRVGHPKIQVCTKKFAAPNSNLGWQNPYMRVSNPSNSSFRTQVRHPNLKLGIAKSVYDGYHPEPIFATLNSNSGWGKPYMRVGHPKLKFPNQNSPPKTRIWFGEIPIWGLATSNPNSPSQTRTWVGEICIWGLATQTQVRHLKLEFGLAKSVYEG